MTHPSHDYKFSNLRCFNNWFSVRSLFILDEFDEWWCPVISKGVEVSFSLWITFDQLFEPNNSIFVCLVKNWKDVLNCINVKVSLDLLHNLLLLFCIKRSVLFVKSHFLHKVVNYFEINAVKISHDCLSFFKNFSSCIGISHINVKLFDLSFHSCIKIGDICLNVRLFLFLFFELKFNRIKVFFGFEVFLCLIKKEFSIHLSEKHGDLIFSIFVCLNVYPFFCNVFTK